LKTAAIDTLRSLEPRMSQRQVAAELGISHGLVQIIERGAFIKIRLFLRKGFE